MIYSPFDVVVVPFPFTDRETTRRRPALVLSGEEFSGEVGCSVLSMITSLGNSSWPYDVPLEDLKQTGLNSPSKVRFKIFTLDDRLIIRKIGVLSVKDRKSVKLSLRRIMP